MRCATEVAGRFVEVQFTSSNKEFYRMESLAVERSFCRAQCYKMNMEQLNDKFSASLRRNDIELAKQLLRSCGDKINVDQLDEEGNAPLHTACSKGRFEAVKLLITAGANVNIVNSKGHSVLHVSAGLLQATITKYLLDSGADVMASNVDGELPLDVASSLETASILADKMVSLGHEDLINDYLLPLKLSKMKEERREQLATSAFVESLQMERTKVSLSDKVEDEISDQLGCRFKLINDDEVKKESTEKEEEGREVFQQQNRRYTFPSYLGFVKQPSGSILKRSNSFTCNEDSTLPEVTEDQAEKMTRKLSNRTVTFPSDMLCQMCIKENDFHDLRRLIITDKITNLNKLYANGITALHLAVIEDRYKCAEVLIDCGAELEIRDPLGWTPLHAAVFAGNIRAVRALCNKGADVCATTNCGETVFDLAVTDLIRKYLKMITVRLVMGEKRNYKRMNSCKT